MRVQVYRNLNAKCLSIMACDGEKRGRVVAHAQAVQLEDCQFVVRPAGRLKVLRERRKNVHAFVKGTLTGVWYESAASCPPFKGKSVRYNPYDNENFVAYDSSKASTADQVRITADGVIKASGVA